MAELKAVIFDCDGVLAETEKDGHRVAFNQVFEEENLGVQWGIEEYGKLVEVAGGKERMKHYFNANPDKVKEKTVDDALIAKMHKRKTEVFTQLIEQGKMPAREGIARIIDEAHEKGMQLFVCSTSNERSVISLIRSLFGDERYQKFDAVLAGDIVKAKKPAPDIYNMVKERSGFSGDECVVIEDSRNGLLAAKAAGMHCLVTVSYYSYSEDFQEADLVVSSLGEPGGEAINVMKSSPLLNSKTLEYVTVEDMRKLVE